MPKGPQGQKRKAKAPSAPKSKKLPRKLPEDSISRAVAIMREATEKPALLQFDQECLSLPEKLEGPRYGYDNATGKKCCQRRAI